EWATRLASHGKSSEAARELPYWLASFRSEAPRLPLDRGAEERSNTVGSAREVMVLLEVEKTRALLQATHQAYRVRLDEVLLTALLEAFAPWTGARALWITLEGHGREAIFE